MWTRLHMDTALGQSPDGAASQLLPSLIGQSVSVTTFSVPKITYCIFLALFQNFSPIFLNLSHKFLTNSLSEFLFSWPLFPPTWHKFLHNFLQVHISQIFLRFLKNFSTFFLEFLSLFCCRSNFYQISFEVYFQFSSKFFEVFLIYNRFSLYLLRFPSLHILKFLAYLLQNFIECISNISHISLDMTDLKKPICEINEDTDGQSKFDIRAIFAEGTTVRMVTGTKTLQY